MFSSKLKAAIYRFLADESGPTAVEYAVMLMLIILAVITSVQAIGTITNGVFSDTSGAFTSGS